MGPNGRRNAKLGGINWVAAVPKGAYPAFRPGGGVLSDIRFAKTKNRKIGFYVNLLKSAKGPRARLYRNTIYVQPHKRGWKGTRLKWIIETVAHESVHAVINYRLGAGIKAAYRLDRALKGITLCG